MLLDKVSIANLSTEQVTMIEHFEKEFNEKYGHGIVFLAFNNKK